MFEFAQDRFESLQFDFQLSGGFDSVDEILFGGQQFQPLGRLARGVGAESYPRNP